MKKEFDLISSKDKLPEIKLGKSISRAVLAQFRNVFFIGHYHVNGQFYLFNNLGSAKTVSTKDELRKPDALENEVFWSYL